MADLIAGVASGRLTTLMAEQNINTSSAENVIGTAAKFAANAYKAGMTISWELNSKISTKGAGSGTLTLRVYLHGVVVDTIVLTPGDGLSAVQAKWYGSIQVRTDGMSPTELQAVPPTAGLVVAEHIGQSATSALATAQSCGSTPTSVDFTSNGSDGKGQLTQVTAQFSVSDVGNIMLNEQFRIEAW